MINLKNMLAVAPPGNTTVDPFISTPSAKIPVGLETTTIGDIIHLVFRLFTTFLIIIIFVGFILYVLSWILSFLVKKDTKLYKYIQIIKKPDTPMILGFFFLVWFVLSTVHAILFSLVGKPVIYLYPTGEQKVTVNLDFKGKLDFTYPKYDYNLGGWSVTAFPDGTIINDADGKKYSYLFWEGTTNKGKYDLSQGWVVEGSKTVEFLQEKLKQLGLNEKEYNEFIVYWAPLMQHNKYNLIHFAQEEYTDIAKLDINPKPDSLLRVFMVYKPLSSYKNIEPQTLNTFNRSGFTVIEWGGTKVY